MATAWVLTVRLEPARPELLDRLAPAQPRTRSGVAPEVTRE